VQPRHSPRHGLRRLAGLLVAVVLGLARPAAAAATGGELSIAVSRSPLSLPLFVAQERGFFAAEGLAVKVRECVGGHRCIQLMLDDEVALATSSEMPVMINSLQRADFAVVATFGTSKRDVKVVARRSAGIARAADLSGKRVATFGGTSAHYFLDLFLLFNGIDTKAVSTLLITPEQLLPALAERRVDAVAAFEPFAHRAQRMLGADGIVLPSARIYTETFNLSAKRSLVAARQADLVRLLGALARAQRFIRDEPREAQAILRRRLDEDQAYVDATWGDFEYRLTLDQPLVSTLEGMARWALREGHVPRTSRIPNYLHFVAPEPLRRVAPAAVTLLH